MIVANLARSPDGVWRALDGEALMKTYRLAAGYLYQAQLRHELTRTLGLEWRQVLKGMAELAHIPDDVLRAFSQRRAQLLDYLVRQGTSGFYAAKVAAVETRDRKEPVDMPRLREERRARAAEHGLGHDELERLLGRAVHRELEPGFRAVSDRLLGPSGLTEKRATFTAADAVMAWAEAHGHGAPVDHVLYLAGRFTAGERVVPVGAAVPGRPAVFSNSELLRCERSALALVERGRGTGGPAVSDGTIQDVVRARGASLGDEQIGMVRRVASSADRVVCVVGRAGAGKTTALAAVAETFRREGVPVLGAAPSGVAADALAAEAGIPAGTLHRLLAQTRQRGRLPAGCVLVVDEAGMADTRTLARALEHVERARGKAILVGDPAQLPAVGAGGLFAAIVDRHGAIALTDNHRQRDELERRALTALRACDSHGYLTDAARRGRLVLADDPLEAKARLVADWWRAADVDLAGNAMVAYRRRDVADLNSVARALMEADGRLGRERVQLASGIELAAGDRVLCTRNDRPLQVTNGTRGTISAIDTVERAITLDADDGRRLTLPAAYLDAGHLTQAYALTGHKTQGLTVENAFVLAAGQGSLKEWGYVALSRARGQTRLYTTEAELEPDTPPTHRPEPPHPVDRLAEALSRPAADTLAVDASRAQLRSQLAESRELAGRQRTLEQRRAETARGLHAATRELDGLGLTGRARQGPHLREQIGHRREQLVRLDAELAGLDRQARALRQRAERTRLRTTPTRQFARERTQQLELGLDL